MAKKLQKIVFFGKNPKKLFTQVTKCCNIYVRDLRRKKKSLKYVKK